MSPSPSPSPSPPPLNSSPPKQQFYLFIILGMALIIIIILLANVFIVGYCAWLWRLIFGQPPPPPPPLPPIGLVQSWIPAYEYKKEGSEEAEECAVCLSGFVEGEMVRRFVQCGHTFHVACIDLWFRSHRNCPVCRSIVLPSPMDSMEMRSEEAMLGRRMDRIITSNIL